MGERSKRGGEGRWGKREWGGEMGERKKYGGWGGEVGGRTRSCASSFYRT